MKSDKFCFNCGGRLDYYEGSLECSSCGASYSNLLISETEYTEHGYRVFEMGVCLDITVKTPVEPLETQEPASVLASPVEIPKEKVTA
jgi:hypothetical protein